jgi:hypothetical protein
MRVSPKLGRYPHFVCIVAAFALAVGAPVSGAFAADDTGLSLWSKADMDTRISNLELVKLLNLYLGGAQQLNIYDDACYSGGLLNAATGLTMPYFIGVGEKDPTKCTYSSLSEKDVNPPGRLKITPPGTSKSFFYSFQAYVTKRLQNVANIATAGSLYDAANADVLADPNLKEDGETPGSANGNGANVNLAINGGAKSNHALIFNGNTGGLYAAPLTEQYRALAQAGYGFTDNGNSLQFYNNNYSAQTFQGAKINGSGSLANLTTALKNIEASVKANPKQQLVNIFFGGHGYFKAAAAPRQNGMNGVPKDGAVVTGLPGGSTTTFALPTDSTFWQYLEVGILPDDNGLERFFPAQFSLAVSEDTLNDPIGIAIDGLMLGSFALASSMNGAELDASLPDSFTAELIAMAAGDPSIPVSFTLGGGDSFRFATEDDALLDPDYLEPQYGFGISTVVGPAVPEPGTGALLLGGVLALAWVRTRTRGF